MGKVKQDLVLDFPRLFLTAGTCAVAFWWHLRSVFWISLIVSACYIIAIIFDMIGHLRN